MTNQSKKHNVIYVLVSIYFFLGTPLKLAAALTDGLILHVDFNEGSYSSGLLTDHSSLNHSVTCQPSLLLGNETYNQCPATTSGPDGTSAGLFSGNLCDMGSDYLGVPSHPSFQNLTQGSLAVWVSYADAPYKTARLIDTLKNFTPGTFLFGRNGTAHNVFQANDDAGNVRQLLQFPDANSWDRNLNQWNHLAVTWDGSTVRGYYNGVLFDAVSQVGISKLNVGTYLTLGALNHGDPRNQPDNNCVNQYGGDPAKSYVQPNTGFLNGRMDDIRVYNRALSASEVSEMATAAGGRQTYIMKAQSSGTGWGGVVSDPSGIYGQHSAEAFAPGTVVRLTAYPLPFSTFTGWSGGGCTGTGDCVITLNEHTTVTANFSSSLVEVASFEAESGVIELPFVVENGILFQQQRNTTISTGGKATYTFNLASDGEYVILMKANGPNSGANSLYVNVDGDPIAVPLNGTTYADYMTWQMPITSGFISQFVSWQGSGTASASSFVPKVFQLSAGPHTLVVRAREPETQIDSISILKKSGTTPSSTPDPAHSWFVDIDVANSGDGKSWSTAWKNFSNINWAAVQPGHTIWISGGVYPEYVEIGKKGTSTNPIRIKVSQETGHNDLVSVSGFSMNGADWITIDGAKDDSFASQIKGTLHVPLIKNNINLKVDGKILDSHGFNMGTGSLDGFKVKWAEVTTSDNHPRFGFRFNPTTGYDNIEISYCWIHDVGDDAVYATQNDKSHYDVLNFHHNLVERVGDDGLEAAAGNTIHHNIIRDTRWLLGHPDGLQTTGNYQRIYNNIFSNWGNSNIRIQGYEESYTGIEIYNNLFYGDTRQPLNPAELVWYGNQQPWNTREHSYWKNWVITNNTFANFTQPNAFTFAKRTYLQNAHIQNLRVQNNLIVNVSNFDGSALGIPGESLPGSSNCCWHNSIEQTIFNHNVVARTAPNFTIQVSYNGKLYSNAEAINEETPYKSNSSSVPAFVNLMTHDYQLSSQDTAARNKGVDLTFLNLPSINEDLAGNARGSDGTWDIGAFEFCDTNCVPPVPIAGNGNAGGGSTGGGNSGGGNTGGNSDAQPDPGNSTGDNTTPIQQGFNLDKFKNIFNPNQGHLMIPYSGPHEIKAHIYDRQGNLIRELFGQNNQLIWDGKNSQGQSLPSGTYVVVIKGEDKTVRKKIILLK